MRPLPDLRHGGPSSKAHRGHDTSLQYSRPGPPQNSLSRSIAMASFANDEANAGTGVDENIWIAASDGNIAKVQAYVQADPSLLQKGDDSGYSPIHAATAWGHKELMHWLVAAGADVHARDADGDTPLHHCDKPEAAEYLITLGASPTMTNAAGQTPPAASSVLQSLPSEPASLFSSPIWWLTHGRKLQARHPTSSHNQQYRMASRRRYLSLHRKSRWCNPKHEGCCRRRSRTAITMPCPVVIAAPRRVSLCLRTSATRHCWNLDSARRPLLREPGPANMSAV